MPGGFRLVVKSGAHAGHVLEVDDPGTMPVKIGRTDDRPGFDERMIGRQATVEHDLLLDDDTLISRCHARIDSASNGYLIVDCGSANKTRLNGEPLKPNMPRRLRSGDQLQFGPDTVVRFEFSDSTQPAPRPSPTPAPKPPVPEPEPVEELAPPAPEPPAPEPQPEPPAPEPVPGPSDEDTPFLFRTDPPPRDQFGKFAIYDSLDKGKASLVDVAVDTQGKRRVALKRFDLSVIPRATRRTLEECAERGTKWDHPGIARVLEYGEQDGMFYVASQLIEGRSLYELQQKHAQEIDVALAVHLARGACAALRHAQGIETGFTWRNLTPRTILVDRHGQAVLINLGFPSALALAEGPEALLAAPEVRYLSPEQRAAKKTDPRSDIFSLGAVLYELLLQGPIDPKRRVLLEIALVRPAVPGPVAEVTSKALVYQAAHRFLHPAEMEEALAEVLQRIAPGYGPEAAEWLAKRV